MAEDPYRRAIEEIVAGLAQLPKPVTLANPNRVRCLQVSFGWCVEIHRLAFGDT
jgi:hypothetical protein